MLYSKVSNRRMVWNSSGGWKKYEKLVVGGSNSRGLEKTENFNSWRGWLLNCFVFPFLTMKTTVLTKFVYIVKVK